MLYQETRRFGAKLCNTVRGSILTMFQRMTPFRQPACTRAQPDLTQLSESWSLDARKFPAAYDYFVSRFFFLVSFKRKSLPTSYGPYQECFSYRVKKGHRKAILKTISLNWITHLVPPTQVEAHINIERNFGNHSVLKLIKLGKEHQRTS